jgi:hypothetical protein
MRNAGTGKGTDIISIGIRLEGAAASMTFHQPHSEALPLTHTLLTYMLR